MRSDRSNARRLALWAFCAWLVVLPLPFGAARTWALALVLPPLFALGVFVSLLARRADETLPGFLVRPPGLFLAGFLAVVALQLVPWGGTPITVAPYRTQLYLLLAFACAVVAWLTTILVRSEQNLRLLMGAILAGGLLQAGMATVLLAAGTGFTLLDSEIPVQSVATGTFVNRNHLAGYLNIALAVGCGLMVGQLAPVDPSRRSRWRPRDALELLLGGKARLRLLLVMLVIVLIATRSRMGNSAFFVALTVATCVYAAYTRSRRRGLLLFAASVVAVDIFLIGAWVGVDRVVERIGFTPLADQRIAAPANGSDTGRSGGAESARAADPRAQQSIEERIEPALYTMSIVRDHPWLGTGGGTFYLVYMAYRPDGNWFWSHAHNDYLEIAADTGVVGLSMLLAFALHSGWAALGLLRRARHPIHRAAGFATLMSMTAMGLHATVDFNLHIPANVLTFCAVLSLPWATWRLRRSGAASQRRPPVDVEPSSGRDRPVAS